MKKIAAVVAALALLISCTASLAEGLTEYSDDHYCFQHPEDWKRETAQDGTVFLQSPDGSAYVKAEILLMDLFAFTGDEEADAPYINVVMKSFAGEETDAVQPTLLLDGSYELIAEEDLKGFRAPGIWRASGEPALLDVFTDGGSMVSFTMVGDQAISLEKTLTSSLRITKQATESKDGMNKWDSEKITLWYPDTFKMMDLGQNGGVVFTELSVQPSTINIMVSELPESEYSDVYGLATMKKVLQQTGTGMEETMKITRVGDQNAVAAEGTFSDTPVANYILGQGKTVVVLNFVGENAVNRAETVIASLEFK